MNYLLVPGAWMGEWVWNELISRLRQKGHDVHPVSLPGLNEKKPSPSIRLADHVQDVLDYIENNGLKDIVLVGHSYSGLVVGQVAAQAPQTVAHTVYIEAFLPVDGQSLLEVAGLDEPHERELIAKNAGLWPPPTREELDQQAFLNDDQKELLARKLLGHPGHTTTDPAILPRPLSTLPSTFMASEGWLSGSREASLLHTLRKEPQWNFVTINGGHWPMLTIPDVLTEHLLEIATGD